jgi:hypothetical protein
MQLEGVARIARIARIVPNQIVNEKIIDAVSDVLASKRFHVGKGGFLRSNFRRADLGRMHYVRVVARKRHED